MDENVFLFWVCCRTLSLGGDTMDINFSQDSVQFELYKGQMAASILCKKHDESNNQEEKKTIADLLSIDCEKNVGVLLLVVFFVSYCIVYMVDKYSNWFKVYSIIYESRCLIKFHRI
jgi:hypothetical protein